MRLEPLRAIFSVEIILPGSGADGLQICSSNGPQYAFLLGLGCWRARSLLPKVIPASPFPEPEITLWGLTLSMFCVQGRDHCQGLHRHIQWVSSLHKHHVLTGSTLQQDLMGDCLGTRSIADCPAADDWELRRAEGGDLKSQGC